MRRFLIQAVILALVAFFGAYASTKACLWVRRGTQSCIPCQQHEVKP